MPLRRVPMSRDEFESLPQHPGWGVDYIGGKAVFWPRATLVFGALQVCNREIKATAATIRPLYLEDEAELCRSAYEAFADSPEYGAWPRQQLAKAFCGVIRGFLAGARGAVSQGSRVAISQPIGTSQGSIVAAILVVMDGSENATIDLLFVVPSCRQQGLATALGGGSLEILAAEGRKRLVSSWHLANDAGRSWHQAFGFQGYRLRSGDPDCG